MTSPNVHAPDSAMSSPLAPSESLSLPDPVLESVLVLAVRQAPLTYSRDAPNLTPPLNVLARSIVPLVSYAALLRLPWIDANVASLCNDVWLLDVMATELVHAPFNRPLQYHDTKLLDLVSARGLISVLDWWHNSGILIGNTQAVQLATDHGHVAVLEWWKESGRLAVDCTRERPISLVEATRAGHQDVLNWWLSLATGDGTDLRAICFHHVVPALFVAFKHGPPEVSTWWVKHAGLIGSVDEDAVASAAIAAGNQAVFNALCTDHASSVLTPELAACSVFSGKLDWVETLLGQCDTTDLVSFKPQLTIWASVGGIVDVLDWLHARNLLDLSAVSFTPAISDSSANVELIHSVLIDARVTEIHPRANLLVVCSSLGHSNVLAWWYAHARKLVVAASNRVARTAILGACWQHHTATVKWWLDRMAHDGQMQWNGNHAKSLVQECAELGFVDLVDLVYSYKHKLSHIEEAMTSDDCNFLVQVLIRGHFSLVDWWIATIEPFPFVHPPHDLAYPSHSSDSLFQAVIRACQNSPAVVAWAVERLPDLMWDDNCEASDNDFSTEQDDSGSGICPVDLLRLFWGNSRFGIGVLTHELFDLLALAKADPSPYLTLQLHAPWDSELYSSCGPQPIMLARFLELFPPTDPNWRLDLDRALSSQAGVAMYAWILSTGRCVYSPKGYFHATQQEGAGKTLGAQWWIKAKLPLPLHLNVSGCRVACRIWTHTARGWVGGKDGCSTEHDGSTQKSYVPCTVGDFDKIATWPFSFQSLTARVLPALKRSVTL